MNFSLSSSAQRHHHWLKDVQFAVGVAVVLGGAGVILADIIQSLV